MIENESEVEWLAKQIGWGGQGGGDSHKIHVDFCNYTIHCDDWRMRNLLVKLADEYLKLLNKERLWNDFKQIP